MFEAGIVLGYHASKGCYSFSDPKDGRAKAPVPRAPAIMEAGL